MQTLVIFFAPPKRFTSPAWGPPPPCKQALIPELWEDNRVIVSKKHTDTIERNLLSLKTTQTLQVKKSLRFVFSVKVHLAYPVSLPALHSNN